MRLTRFVRFQLVLFTVVGVAGIAYGAFSYVGVQRMLGIGWYGVTMQTPEAAGLYANAIVTYRGVDIGVVKSVDLQANGVSAQLRLRDDFKVPANAEANIRSVSAIGEQYVDLVPPSSDGPYLGNGSVIRADQVSLPTSATAVLTSASLLLQSLPTDALRSTLDETFNAFNGTGPALHDLITNSNQLVGAANDNADATIKLVRDANPLLTTTARRSPEISSFTHDLASFSQQLVMSDADIRATLAAGPSFADTTGNTLTDLQQTVPILLANLQTAGQVLLVNNPGLRQILVIYPAIVAWLGSSGSEPLLKDHKLFPLDFGLADIQNPPPCTIGFEDIVRRHPRDLTPTEPSTTSYCKVAPDDPRDVRGARNTPCATDPAMRTAELAQCPMGLPSTWPGMLAHPQPAAAAPDVPLPAEAPPPGPPAAFPNGQAVVPYDPNTGTFLAPDGTPMTVPAVTNQPQPQEQKWQDLLLPGAK
jgi:phospholipid/cholesterol/gamma-HCH transport system substrate-binding protein